MNISSTRGSQADVSPRLRRLAAAACAFLLTIVMTLPGLVGAAFAADVSSKGVTGTAVSAVTAPGGGMIVNAGSSVTLNGAGYTAGAALTIKYDDDTVLGTTNVAQDGTYSTPITVPQDATAGQHWLRVLGTGTSFPAYFTVAQSAGSVSAKATSGAGVSAVTGTQGGATLSAGSVVTVAGAGYSEGTQLSFKLDDVSEVLATATVAQDGTYSTQVTIPADAASGQHWLRILGTAVSHTAYFLVAAEESAAAQDSPQPTATPTATSTPTDAATDDARQVTNPAPTTAPRAEIGDGSVTVSPASAGAGATITVTGTDFVAGNSLSLKFDDGAYTVNNSQVIATAEVGDDGTFSVQATIPTGFGDGTHWVRVLGSTPQVSKVATFTVAGVAQTSDTGAGDSATTAPTPDTGSSDTGSTGTTAAAGECVANNGAMVRTNTEWELGSQVTVTGTGFLTKDGTGSIAAIKLDGKTLHRNFDLPAGTPARATGDDTVWAVANADAAGNFSVTFDLPNATNNTGAVAWEAGTTHEMTILTGSLKDNDNSRSIKISVKVVAAGQGTGTSSCNGVVTFKQPTAADLTDANQHDLIAQVSDSTIKIALSADVQVGEKSRVFGFAADGTVRVITADKEGFAEVDANHHVTFAADSAQFPSGTWRLVAVDGAGTITGWTTIENATGSSAASTVVNNNYQTINRSVTTVVQSAPSAATATTAKTAVSANSSVNTAKPAGVPGSPITQTTELTAENAGSIATALENQLLTITVPDTIDPGTWVSLTVYPGQLSAGWVQVDTQHQLKLNVSSLSAGAYQLVVGDRSNNLLGWSSFTIKSAAAKSTQSAGSSSSAVKTTTVLATTAETNDSWLSINDWLLIAAAIVLAAGAGLLALIIRRPSSQH